MPPLRAILAMYVALVLVLTGTLRVGGNVVVIPHTHGEGAPHRDHHDHDHEDNDQHCHVQSSCVPDNGDAPHTPPHVHISDVDTIAGRVSDSVPAAALEPGIDVPLPLPGPAPLQPGWTRHARAFVVLTMRTTADSLRTTRIQV
jgi:hypothetical protein